MRRLVVEDIREEFVRKYEAEDVIIDKSGCRMLEIVSASFIANEPTIFGKPNDDYVRRELLWYHMLSLNVNDFPGGAPKTWVKVATPKGDINSNYGWCVWSDENGSQYKNVLTHLKKNMNTRQAVMIYTRPTMHVDYNRDGMMDFICTNAVQYLIRNGELIADVQMRSNDVFAGYRNDLAWQKYVHERLSSDLDVEKGPIYWHAGSLHVYENDFWRVDCYRRFGEHLTKKEYEARV